MGPGSTRCTAAVPGRPNSVYSYHVPRGNISVTLHGAAAVTTRNAPRQKESGRDWCEGGCRPRPQVAGQKPNLALIPGDSAKVAEVVYYDATGVQLAEGALESRANRNPQSGDSAIFGRCSNMPTSTLPRGHFSPTRANRPCPTGPAVTDNPMSPISAPGPSQGDFPAPATIHNKVECPGFFSFPPSHPSPTLQPLAEGQPLERRPGKHQQPRRRRHGRWLRSIRGSTVVVNSDGNK